MTRHMVNSWLCGGVLALGLCSTASAQESTTGRRGSNGSTTVLAFRDVAVETLVPFIVETTGKVVIPSPEVMKRKITIINDQPLAQDKALDLVFLAMRQLDIAIIETDEIIMLRDMVDLMRYDVPVIGPDESVLGRQDIGTVAEKIYRLNNSTAKTLGEALKDFVPDYAKMTVDEESNQLVLRGTMALLQRMEQVINSLDQPGSAALQTETFRLRFADAESVAENIKELYESEDSRQNTQQQQQMQRFFQQQGRGRGEGQDQGTATSANIRVTSNKQQNSVTVLAEERILDQIRGQIESVWDQPLPQEAVVPKIYDLKYSDPIKVRDLLEGLFGTPTTAQAGGAQSSQGVGRLAGQFSFQAIPEAGRLVVISKSPDNLFVIDEIINGVDQPQSIGLPEIVALKHASSEELAEQLNALLATESTLAQIRRSETGLSANSATSSPFAQDAGEEDAAAEETPDTMTFWWQRARQPTDNRGSSNLVGKIRIVPVWRQNAVMVLAPPEYKQSVVDMINDLDRPGRQVFIKAVIAEVSRDDSMALGLRWSSETINPTNEDNSLSIGLNSTAQENGIFGNLFDTSVLDLSANVNVILQALAEKTDVNILSEPRVFTSDNQEAEFFDGQDIPFVVDSQTTDQGGITQSFDYRAVGIQLRARPRITVNRDVDLRVNVELSSIAPQLAPNGAFIVDRRETTTQLIVKDGQTIVISGILRDEDSELVRKVPLLGDIPLIGEIFKSRETTSTKTELVIFITPHVVENPSEMDEVNAPFRQRLNELRDELGEDDKKERIDTPE